jgi:hypothetical protein
LLRKWLGWKWLKNVRFSGGSHRQPISEQDNLICAYVYERAKTPSNDVAKSEKMINQWTGSGNIQLVCKDYIYNRTEDCEDTTFDCKSCHLYPEKVCGCAHTCWNPQTNTCKSTKSQREHGSFLDKSYFSTIDSPVQWQHPKQNLIINRDDIQQWIYIWFAFVRLRIQAPAITVVSAVVVCCIATFQAKFNALSQHSKQNLMLYCVYVPFVKSYGGKIGKDSTRRKTFC